jgi:hypothetical protein
MAGAGLLAPWDGPVLRPNLLDALRGTLLPGLDLRYIGILSIPGTTISRYLFFTQASSEVDPQMDVGRHRLW